MPRTVAAALLVLSLCVCFAWAGQAPAPNAGAPLQAVTLPVHSYRLAPPVDEVVREVLHTLEQQFVVVSLVQNILDRGMSVAIGVEHGVEPLAACSVVVAPVVVDGEHLGSVGVLGPTRMNYPQALATVGLVSDRLGRHLGDAG